MSRYFPDIETPNMVLPMAEIEAEASEIAGNTGLVAKADRLFDEVGWAHVPRLNSFDLGHHKNLYATTSLTPLDVGNNDYMQFLKQALPEAGFTGPDDDVEGLIDGLRDNDAFFQSLDRKGASRFLGKVRTFFGKNDAADIKTPTPVLGMISEDSPLTTRQEMLASLSDMECEWIRADLYMSLEEMQAWTNAHEFAHSLSHGQFTGEARYEALRNMKLGDIATQITDRPGLQQVCLQASQTKNINEPYMRYLDECISDTTASLFLLQQGSEPGTLHELADARQVATLKSLDTHYDTCTCVRHVADHADELEQELADADFETLHERAMQIVASQGFDRGQYYAFAQSVWQTMGLRARQGDRASFLEKHQHYIKDIRLPAEHLAEFDDWAQNAKVDAENRLMPDDVEPLDHIALAAETLAACRYAQARNPEYATPEGLRMLLRQKERLLSANAVPPTDPRREVIALLDEHYEQVQEAGLERAPQKAAEMGR